MLKNKDNKNNNTEDNDNNTDDNDNKDNKQCPMGISGDYARRLMAACSSPPRTQRLPNFCSV